MPHDTLTLGHCTKTLYTAQNRPWLSNSMRYYALLLFILFSAPLSASPKTFFEAKKQARLLFASHQQTLYCQCRYQHNRIDLSSCGMKSAAHHPRAQRLEWEHIMPVEHFGKHFACWRLPLCAHKGNAPKGRRCCAQVDARFRAAEAELYNLWPAVGLVNQARSNFRFAALPARSQFFGCSFTVDKKARKVEPQDKVKGLVARATLFMAYRYRIRLSYTQKQLFRAWNQHYPPESWERQWAARVAAVEGYDNPYISQWPKVL